MISGTICSTLILNHLTLFGFILTVSLYMCTVVQYITPRKASREKQCKQYSHWQLSNSVCEVKAMKGDECLMTSVTPLTLLLYQPCRHRRYWKLLGPQSTTLPVPSHKMCVLEARRHTVRTHSPRTRRRRVVLTPSQQQLEVSLWII